MTMILFLGEAATESVTKTVDASDQLAGLQALVGGPIEIAARRDGLILLVNEEGLYAQKGVNLLASRWAGYRLVGDAVVISEKDFQ